MGMTAPLAERVYCAGPYNPTFASSTPFNIARAIEQAQKVRELGFVPVCPHVAVFAGTANDEAAMQERFSHLDTCDVLVLLEDWAFSKGTLREKERAESRGILVYESIAALAEAKKDDLPVTLNGVVRVLWFHLARIIEKECRAGMTPPAAMPRPWHHRFGLFETWLNGRPEPMLDRGSGTTIPPMGLLIEHAGAFIGIVTQAGTAIREGCTDQIRRFTKAVRDEADSLGGVIQ
jgi:hypothetical protein